MAIVTCREPAQGSIEPHIRQDIESGIRTAFELRPHAEQWTATIRYEATLQAIGVRLHPPNGAPPLPEFAIQEDPEDTPEKAAERARSACRQALREQRYLPTVLVTMLDDVEFRDDFRFGVCDALQGHSDEETWQVSVAKSNPRTYELMFRVHGKDVGRLGCDALEIHAKSNSESVRLRAVLAECVGAFFRE